MALHYLCYYSGEYLFVKRCTTDEEKKNENRRFSIQKQFNSPYIPKPFLIDFELFGYEYASNGTLEQYIKVCLIIIYNTIIDNHLRSIYCLGRL